MYASTPIFGRSQGNDTAALKYSSKLEVVEEEENVYTVKFKYGKLLLVMITRIKKRQRTPSGVLETQRAPEEMVLLMNQAFCSHLINSPRFLCVYSRK